MARTWGSNGEAFSWKVPPIQFLPTDSRSSASFREYELLDTGILDDNKYFDVMVEYAQADLDDTLAGPRLVGRACHEKSELLR